MNKMEGNIKKEQIYIIPLREVKNVPKWKRANKAINIIREYLSRHMKSSEIEIKIDKTINEKVWSKGIENPPSKIKVRAAKYSDGEVQTEIAL